MCSSLSAQVGIRTDNPQGMLHVDAKGNTYVGLSDTVNISDDVVVTPEGRIGVGTLKPQARLDILSATPGAIRIADGSQGPGKILTSDNTGAAGWASGMVGGWYAALKGGRSEGATTGDELAIWPAFDFSSSEISSPGTGSADHELTEAIVVPYTASYRITLTGYGHTNLATNLFLVYIKILVNTSLVEEPHQHSVKDFGPLNFGFMLHRALKANDTVGIAPYGTRTAWANQYTDVTLHVELIK